MTLIWVAGIILVGEGLIALMIHRAIRTFGYYGEKLQKTHEQNLELRKNIAIQQNTEALNYFLDNPTEREA